MGVCTASTSLGRNQMAGITCYDVRSSKLSTLNILSESGYCYMGSLLLIKILFAILGSYWEICG